MVKTSGSQYVKACCALERTLISYRCSRLLWVTAVISQHTLNIFCKLNFVEKFSNSLQTYCLTHTSFTVWHTLHLTLFIKLGYAKPTEQHKGSQCSVLKEAGWLEVGCKLCLYECGVISHTDLKTNSGLNHTNAAPQVFLIIWNSPMSMYFESSGVPMELNKIRTYWKTQNGVTLSCRSI